MSLLLEEGLLGPGLNQQQASVCSAWAHAGLGASGASVPGANTEVVLPLLLVTLPFLCLFAS